MTIFQYPCPECGTASRVHEFDCEYEDTKRWQYEKAYVDILSTLLDHAVEQEQDDKPPGLAYNALRERVSSMLEPPGSDESEAVELSVLDAERDVSATEPDTDGPNQWVSMHNDCLAALKRFGRVTEREEMGGLYLTEPNEDTMGIVPVFDPIQTVFEYGPIDGCKDISVYSMVSWCELKDLSWDATVEFMEWWLTETNRWETERWGESSIEQLCNQKRHVYREEMGWGDHPAVAKNKMEDSAKSKQLDASEVAVDRSTFE